MHLGRLLLAHQERVIDGLEHRLERIDAARDAAAHAADDVAEEHVDERADGSDGLDLLDALQLVHDGRKHLVRVRVGA